MRNLVALSLIVLFGVPAPGDAGAWPRDRGTWFVSSDMRFSWAQDADLRDGAHPLSQYYTLYLEYGLPRDLTIGLDLGRSVSGAAKNIAFLRLPLRNAPTGIKLSADLGLGKIDGQPVVRPGMSLGLGFTSFGASGWFAADAVAEIAQRSRRTDYKLDVTYGLTFKSGTKALLQLQTGIPDRFEPFVRIAPSMVFPFGDSRHVEIGAMYGLTGDDTFGIKFGVWQSF